MRRVLGIVAVIAGLATASPAAATTLEIPRMSLRVHVGTSLAHGPAWWPGSRTAIAGHRVTHTRPFRHLDWLRPGDVVYLDGAEYRVTGHRVVRAGTLVRLPTAGHLLLSACTPPGSASYRLVVYATRVFSGWIQIPPLG